jgi:hypothetical protein
LSNDGDDDDVGPYCMRSATCRMSAGAAHTNHCVTRAMKGKYLLRS